MKIFKCCFIILCTMLTIFVISSKCATPNKDNAILAIAATQQALNTLQEKIAKQFDEAIFQIGELKEDQDLTTEQLKKIKTIVNRVKTTLFNIPTCVNVQDFGDMEKDQFMKGKALSAKK